MTKHTPGPWMFASAPTAQQLGKVYPKPRAVGGGIVGCIATIGRPAASAGEPEAIANARLIAAAPDLLVALRDLVQLEADGRAEYESAIEYWERARAAIAKATGGQA